MFELMPPREQFLEGHGIQLRTCSWGDPTSRDLIIFLHGYLDSSRTWDFVATCVSAALPHYHVVAYDHRGHGDSDRVPRGGYYHFPDYVADLQALLTRIPHQNLTLIGHSMGGNVAAYFTGARPHLVRRLVMLESMMVPDSPWEMIPDRLTRWLDDVYPAPEKTLRPLANLEEVARRLQLTMPHASPQALLHLAPLAARPVTDGWLWRFDPLHRTTSPVPFLLGYASSLWRSITCPVLNLEGALTTFFGGMLQERYAHLRHNRVQVISDAGHAMHVENPMEVSRVLLDFIEQT